MYAANRAGDDCNGFKFVDLVEDERRSGETRQYDDQETVDERDLDAHF